MRDSKLYLKDILEAMNSIELFVEGIDFEEFKKDDKTSSAVIRKFELLVKQLNICQRKLKKSILTFHGEKWPE